MFITHQVQHQVQTLMCKQAITSLMPQLEGAEHEITSHPILFHSGS